jgi:hypothetical protein
MDLEVGTSISEKNTAFIFTAEAHTHRKTDMTYSQKVRTEPVQVKPFQRYI